MLKIDPLSELLDRSVNEVIVRENAIKRLKEGRKLRVKFGIDPTAPDLHLGHLVPLLKLKAFQDLGHAVVFIIGDFTAMIGDPTGRNELRKPLTREETKKNAQDYLAQASRVIDVKKMEVHYNSEWLDKLGISGFYELLSKVTIQRALERDDFQKRLKEDNDITILESIYPLMQGYDSVAIKADLEIGGTDQKFNLLMGRRIQRRYDQPEQDIMTLWLIEGTDGVRKMSKSYGNYIALDDVPAEMYGKVMSIPDTLIVKYLTTFSSRTMPEIDQLSELWKTDRINFPARDLKMALARDVVSLCHGKKEAMHAEAEFIRIFQKKDAPSEIKEKKLKKEEWQIFELLVECGLASSKSEARRLVEGGGVKVDDEKMLDPKKPLRVGKKPLLIQVGKRHFIKVKHET